MTPHQFRAALDRLSLRQIDAARLLGVGVRTVKAWSQIDGTGPTGPAARFLRYIVETGASPQAVEEIVGGEGGQA